LCLQDFHFKDYSSKILSDFGLNSTVPNNCRTREKIKDAGLEPRKVRIARLKGTCPTSSKTPLNLIQDWSTGHHKNRYLLGGESCTGHVHEKDTFIFGKYYKHTPKHTEIHVEAFKS
jgi:hypothetical protein